MKQPGTIDMFDSPLRLVKSEPALGLRPYQAEVRAAVAEVHERVQGALVVLPTGTGKSRCAGAIAWDHQPRGGKVLVLSPTIVLCRQMYNDMRALGLSCAIEQADNRALRPLPDVTVGSVATLRGDRLKSFGRDAFSLVIADECHRAISDQYSEIFNHFASAKRLGLTATPSRADGVSLANAFDEVAYSMTMLEAIRDGWLVPLRIKTAQTDWDPKRVRDIAGEVAPGSVARELVRSGCLHQAANALADLAAGERTVAFLPTVASSKAFVGELHARGVRAAHIDGTTPELAREQAFALFKSGEVRVLSNVGVLTEGWDAPHASVIALLNPTKSWSRLAQMIGRGTRLCEGKESALIIDFCPGRMTKGRLASPADALAGRMLSDAVVDQLEPEGDLAEVVEAAESRAEEIEARKRQAEAVAARKAEQVERLKHEAKAMLFHYGVDDHDMREVFEGGSSRSKSRKAADAVTDRQKLFLLKEGFQPEELAHLTRRTAMTLLDKVVARRQANLASRNQLGKLHAHGVSGTNVTFPAAKAAIEYLENAGRAADPARVNAIITAKEGDLI